MKPRGEGGLLGSVDLNDVASAPGLTVAVLGAGVIGLSTACLLLRAGCDVTIYAESVPPFTGSDVACAVWCPFFVGEAKFASADRQASQRLWAEQSWLMFEALQDSNVGVRWTTNIEMYPSQVEEPFWADIVKDFSSGHDPSLPPGFTFQTTFRTFIVETPRYMAELVAGFVGQGGRIVNRRVASVDDVTDLDARIVFNCTGLGSRTLWGDNDVRPVKGQLLLHAPRDLVHTLGAGDFAVVPRSDALVLGTLFEEDFDTAEPTDEASDRIWETVSQWFRPEDGAFDSRVANLSRDSVRQTVSGMRPYRAQGIRLEAERLRGKLIIHDYGHGGGGITYSWGCALDAVRLMFAMLD